MTSAAPDLVEPILGWRCWQAVEAVDGSAALGSVVYPTVWPRRRRFDAQCEAAHWHLRAPFRRTHEHPAPAASCGCGVYAVPDVERALRYLDWDGGGRRSHLRVLGLVRLWGVVLECDRGWRAEHAYPLRLYVVSPTRRRRDGDEAAVAAELAAYGVPVDSLPCPLTAVVDELERRREPVELPRPAALPVA